MDSEFSIGLQGDPSEGAGAREVPVSDGVVDDQWFGHGDGATGVDGDAILGGGAAPGDVTDCYGIDIAASGGPFPVHDDVEVSAAVPAGDLPAGFSFAEDVPDNPYDLPALSGSEASSETSNLSAGPHAGGLEAGASGAFTTTMGDLVWSSTMDAANRAYQDVLSGTGPVAPYAGPGLFANAGLSGLGAWTDDLIASGLQSGAYSLGSGGYSGLLQSMTNHQGVSTDVSGWGRLVSSDDQVMASRDWLGYGLGGVW